MKNLLHSLLAVATLLPLPPANAEKAAPFSALATMPVKEVTVFKDGHAFVLHSGKMPVDADGNVEMDYLPMPVLGTFWPYSADKQAKLSAVTAGQRKILVERTALTLRALIAANIGAEVTVTETQPVDSDKKPAPLSYRATILGMPEQSSGEIEKFNPPNSGPMLPRQGDLVLLKLQDGGTKVTDIARILNITFLGAHKETLAQEEFRNMLTLKLDWGNGKPQKAAEMGLSYVQRGIRWIPSYKIVIDGKGNATVKLQATLLNELADLDDVTCHMVIGVPAFQFKDTVDPISLQNTLAQLSQYFRESDPSGSQTQMLSNSMMTQVARMGESRGRPTATQPPDLGPEAGGSEQTEDLFVFTMKHVTLRKGQRMVMPVTEFKVPYKNVYTLDLPIAPPPEIHRQFNNQQQSELARLLNAPKAIHKLRMQNTSKFPLTTAPALIMTEDSVLGQGMMTYTSAGGSVDLAITTAVDIHVRKLDRETKRVPNAMQWEGNQYAGVELEGKITLTNYRKEPATIEVVRYVLGSASEADQNGKAEMVNVLEDSYAPAGAAGSAAWWSWYSWPSWWHRVNGTGRIQWTVNLEPGKAIDLNYKWKYHWR